MKKIFLLVFFALSSSIFAQTFSTKDQVRLDLWYLGLKNSSEPTKSVKKIQLPADLEKQVKQL